MAGQQRARMYSAGFTLSRRWHGWRPSQTTSDLFTIGGWGWLTWSVQRERKLAPGELNLVRLGGEFDDD